MSSNAILLERNSLTGDALTNANILARRQAATPRGIGVRFDLFADRAENAELWDVEGRRYIDFTSGVAVTNVGHRHPLVVKAIREQLERFIHTGYQIVPYESYVRLAERINAATPGTHAKKTAFFTTGGEAVENAIKVARAATGRPAIIAFNGGFHGRTLMGLALTGKVAPYKMGFGPLPSEVYHAPFPSSLYGITVEDSLKAIDTLLKVCVDPRRLAAIIFEPVQGEGGFYPAPAEFVRALRQLCDTHGALLIADEIQTGFGRTGRLFAMEHFGVIPDIVTIAKSMADGVPLSGVCGRAEVMDASGPGGLGGTYAGNALAVAAAHAVLDIIEEEKLVERSRALGERLQQRLQRLQKNVSQLAEVRALGSMVAAEFTKPRTIEPDPEFTKRVQAAALKRGLLLLICGLNNNVIRFLYPLTIADATFEEAMQILEETMLDPQ